MDRAINILAKELDTYRATLLKVNGVGGFMEHKGDLVNSLDVIVAEYEDAIKVLTKERDSRSLLDRLNASFDEDDPLYDSAGLGASFAPQEINTPNNNNMVTDTYTHNTQHDFYGRMLADYGSSAMLADYDYIAYDCEACLPIQQFSDKSEIDCSHFAMMTKHAVRVNKAFYAGERYRNKKKPLKGLKNVSSGKRIRGTLPQRVRVNQIKQI